MFIELDNICKSFDAGAKETTEQKGNIKERGRHHYNWTTVQLTNSSWDQTQGKSLNVDS